MTNFELVLCSINAAFQSTGCVGSRILDRQMRTYRAE